MCLFSQAASDGRVETLQELAFKFEQVSVPQDSLINMYNPLGYTMLHYAIMYKQLECITSLIEMGAGMQLYLIRSVMHLTYVYLYVTVQDVREEIWLIFMQC